MRIVSVVGARPNFMKVAPLDAALRELGIDHRIVHTGQHYDWEMSQAFLSDLGLPAPDYELGVGSGSHAEQTGRVMLGLEPVLRSERPRVVVVYGDVNSTVAASLTAKKLDLDLAHVEAGLRSRDRTMPEELNRIVTDALSDVLFCPSSDAVDNLRAEGIPAERIELVGNLMIDSLDSILPKARESFIVRDLGLAPSRFVLVTLHRPSNVDARGDLVEVVRILEDIGKIATTVFAAHPRTSAALKLHGFRERLHNSRVVLLPPQRYIDFVRLLADAGCIVTDSGGIQEEASVLGTPCLTMRNTTERPITITEGTNTLVARDREQIAVSVKTALHTERRPRRPSLWDGHAAARAARCLKDRYGDASG